MASKFLPVVVAVFIINLGTAVAEDHDFQKSNCREEEEEQEEEEEESPSIWDCYNYEAKAPNGKRIIDIFHECGVKDVKTFQNPKLFKCVVKPFQVVKDDGTFKEEKMKRLIKKYANPEYYDQIRGMLDEILKQPPENLYTAYPKELAKICPNDQFNRNP